jgi:hypothetical protein
VKGMRLERLDVGVDKRDDFLREVDERRNES